MSRHSARVEPLTPIHVGTGNQFGPMEYWVNADEYVRFDIDKVIGSMDEKARKRLFQAIDSGQMMQMNAQIQIAAQMGGNGCSLYKCRAWDEFANRWRTVNRGGNQLLVDEMMRTPGSWKPLLPGSSIKGAIRTAVLDMMANGKRFIDEKDRWHGKVENRILENRNPNDDPFRAILVSDCHLNESGGVGEVSNYNPNKDEPFISIQMLHEAVQGSLGGFGDEGTLVLSVDEPLQRQKYVDRRGQGPDRGGGGDFERRAVSGAITLRQILEACNRFYPAIANEEHEKFYRRSPSPELIANSKKLLERIAAIEAKQQCVIRLGRFSHVESVTLNFPNRHPSTRKGIWGKTRNIFEKQWPMGWALLTFEEA